MTSRTTTLIRKGNIEERYPDFPPRDDMQNWRHLYRNGMQMALQVHYQSEPGITVACEVPVGPSLSARGDVRIPDLSVMEGGDTELMLAQGGYAIDRQGKAPDFVLEIASPTTGVADYTDKRDDYERYGVLEYWRFDPSGGDYHDKPLAGDRLVGGRYESIAVQTLGDGLMRGYSEALDLYLCWEHGEFRFFDAKTGSYLRTHSEELDSRLAEAARADVAEAQAQAERDERVRAEAQVQAEREERIRAEGRAAELAAELRRLRGE